MSYDRRLKKKAMLSSFFRSTHAGSYIEEERYGEDRAANEVENEGRGDLGGEGNVSSYVEEAQMGSVNPP
jgi:hypothetical protein